MQSWLRAIPLLREGYGDALLEEVAARRRHALVLPPQEQLFRALHLTPFGRVRVVLLGQDPYHGPGQAHGLAFSVPAGAGAPPSLRNIFREVAADIYGGAPPAFSPDLSRWARQGVLLLNAALSVEAGKPGSHQALGWQQLTDQIVAVLSQRRRHLVFLLWGAQARKKRALVDADKHLVLEAAHPSPLSAHRGFFGCRHFSRTNAYLEAHGRRPIIW